MRCLRFTAHDENEAREVVFSQRGEPISFLYAIYLFLRGRLIGAAYNPGARELAVFDKG